MKNTIKSLLIGATVLALALLSPGAHACSVCMGASDSTVAPAANGAIFSMFGVIGAVLSAIAGFIFHLARLARRQ